MTAPERLRVLTVVDTLAVGGAERVAVDIANALDRTAHEVLVCSTRHDGPMRDELADDVSVKVFGRRHRWDLNGLARFVRFVQANDIDIIHSHGRGTVQLVSLARQMGLGSIPQVFHDHYGAGHVDRSAPRALRWALRRGVDQYLGVDRRLCRWAIETVGLPAQRVDLVMSGVDRQRFEGVAPVDLRVEFDLPARDVVLVMVAHFRHQKDQPTLFRALAALPRSTLDRLGVVIVGRTPTDTDFAARCLTMVEELALGDHVRIAGSRSDITALLAGADGGLLATKNETGPIAVLEYMAAGLPFVASDTGEITRSVRGHNVGFTPEPRSPEALAAALDALVRLGPDGRAEMGARGRALAEENFDQAQVAARVAAIYAGVLGSGSRPGGVPARPERRRQTEPATASRR